MILGGSIWPKDNAPVQNEIPIVFLHGLGGTGSLWRPISIAFEKKHWIIAPDQRGHGQSQAVESGDFSPEQYAKDVHETVEKFCHDQGITKQIWIIGHSMGARTALLFACTYPKLTKGVVLIDIGFQGAAGGGLGSSLEKLLKELPRVFPSRPEAKTWLMAHSPDPSIAQYLLACSVASETGVSFPFNPEALLETLGCVKGRNFLPFLSALGEHPIKTLVLRGENSTVYSKSDFESNRSDLKNFNSIEFEEIKNTGHGLPFEKRAEFVSRLKTFMS